MAQLVCQVRDIRPLKDLYPLPANWPANKKALDASLRGRFPALQLAVEQFRPYVPLWKQGAFNRAWSTYHSDPDAPCENQCYYHYMDIQNIDEPATDGKVAFRRNVEALLAFAVVK